MTPYSLEARPPADGSTSFIAFSPRLLFLLHPNLQVDVTGSHWLLSAFSFSSRVPPWRIMWYQHPSVSSTWRPPYLTSMPTLSLSLFPHYAYWLFYLGILPNFTTESKVKSPSPSSPSLGLVPGTISPAPSPNPHSTPACPWYHWRPLLSEPWSQKH